MRNLIRGMLIVATLSVGVGTSLTSCKDNYDELAAEMRRDNVDLNQRLNDLKAIVDGLKSCTCNNGWVAADEQLRLALEALINGLQTQVDGLNQALAGKADQTTVNAIQGQITTLTNEIGEISSTLSGITSGQSNLDSIVNALQNIVIPGLDSQISGLQGQINGQDTVIQNLDTKITAYISTVNNTLDSYLTSIKNLQSMDSTMNVRINELEGKFDDYVTTDAFETYKTAQAIINQQVTDNKTAIENLQLWQTTVNNKLTEIETAANNAMIKATDAYTKAEVNERRLNSLDSTITVIRDEFTRVDSRLASLDSTLLATQSEVRTLSVSLDSALSRITSLEIDAAQFRTDINNNAAAITNLNNRVTKLFDALDQRLNDQITSMTLEAAYNPVFGTFNTPFGINSNVLIAFWGQSVKGDVYFPDSGTGTEFDGEEVITDADMQMLGVSPEQFGGLFLKGQDDNYVGNLGSIYFRTNPGQVNMNGKTFSIVNSIDEPCKVTLDNVQKSYDVLDFGYTNARSMEDNGMYKAYASLRPENIADVKLSIDTELKGAVSDVLHQRSLASLASLSKIIYDQISGVLPNYAVKAYWEYTDAEGNLKPQSVYTQGGIAATAVKPLSFGFLYDRSVPSRFRLPILDPITELINADDFKFDIDMDSIKMEGAEITFEIDSVKVNFTGDLTVQGGMWINGDYYPLENTAVEGTDELVAAIEDAINQALGDISAEMKTQVEQIVADMQQQIEDQVNAMLDNISGQINGQIADLINNINNKADRFLERYNSFLPRYNSLAARINKALDNPNHYLQTLMVYKNGDNGSFHLLSNNVNRPSTFELAGGNGIYLYATTRTAETVAPAFKKFVGVTNVWKTSDKAQNAQAGNAAAKALLDQANQAGNMDEVIDGDNMKVTLYVPGAAQGYTYEIVYSALDYAGVTSTQKYYVSVR